jgi:hypothetical protein
VGEGGSVLTPFPLPSKRDQRDRDPFEFFRKFAEIFASQGAPPVSTTPVANLPPVSITQVANCHIFATGINDTGGKLCLQFPLCCCHRCQRYRRQIAAGVNNAGGKLPPVSTTPAANLPPVSLTPVANNWNNIRLQTPESELEGKNLSICLLYYPKVTK